MHIVLNWFFYVIHIRITELNLCLLLHSNKNSVSKIYPTNNKRGRGSGPCLLWGGLDKSRHIVPTALLVRVQCFRKCLSSTRSIILSMIIWSYFRCRRCLTIFEPDETNKLRVLTSLVWRLDHRRRPVERFIQKLILETILHKILKKSSECDLKNFANVFSKLVI